MASRHFRFFRRGHATLHLAVSVGMSVGPSVGRSVTFLNSERFPHYGSCPTVRDWIAVYPALFFFSSSPFSIARLLSQVIIHLRAQNENDPIR